MVDSAHTQKHGRTLMKKHSTWLLCALLVSVSVGANTEHLQQAIDSKYRTAKNIQRDQYRNPLKTLQLFDIQPNHTVVEVWPGGGWYTEILAPYLKEQGQLIAAHYDPQDKQANYRAGSRAQFEKKMKATPKAYSKVKVASLMLDETTGALVKGAAKHNSIDRVVTFRNAHGMYASGTLDTALSHFFDILKPAGKLGIVQHQAGLEQDWMSKNIGYISRMHIISVATKAGFILEAEGYFNHNPLDTKHYERGIWQLPPGLAGLKTDEEKAPFLAIGESDRMTLLFTKP
jgi:predicted methyltransferase